MNINKSTHNATLITILMIILYSISSYISKIDYYQIDNIVIRGNNFLDEKSIRQITKEYILTQKTTNINLKKIQKKINQNIYINSSSIYTLFPSSIFIHINEINPIGLYEKDKVIYFIDYSSKLIKADTKSINFFNVPVINENSINDFNHKKTTTMIKQIINNNTKLYSIIDKIIYNKDTINIILNNKTKISLNRKNIMKQLQTLIEFCKKLNNNITIYEYIDFTIKNQIIVKEKNINI